MDNIPMTWREELIQVRKAIYAITQQGIQRYKIGEQEVTRANLKELQAREKWLVDNIRAGVNPDSSIFDEAYFDGKVRQAFEPTI